MKSSMWHTFLFFGDYTLIILTRPVVAFCISSVFEGLTIFETNPDINIYIYKIIIYNIILYIYKICLK